jgi:hypothetical protein
MERQDDWKGRCEQGICMDFCVVSVLYINVTAVSE